MLRSTSNETFFLGTDLKALLHTMYPPLTADELDEFNKVYDRAQFSSDDEWIRTGTGEPFFRCGVRSYPDFIVVIEFLTKFDLL